MPEYLYTDGEGHEVTKTHRMLYTTSVYCDICGAEMWRKPQPVSVTWGGLSPSQGAVNKRIRNLINSAPERRDNFDKAHDAHEKRSEQ